MSVELDFRKFTVPERQDGLYYARKIQEHLEDGRITEMLDDPYLAQLFNPLNVRLSSERKAEILLAHERDFAEVVRLKQELDADRSKALLQLAQTGVGTPFDGINIPAVSHDEVGGLVTYNGNEVFVKLGWGQIGWYQALRDAHRESLESTVSSVRESVLQR